MPLFILFAVVALCILVGGAYIDEAMEKKQKKTKKTGNHTTGSRSSNR